MAEDKRKILENARKYAQKGAKEKALKEYQKLVKLDPKDVLKTEDAGRLLAHLIKPLPPFPLTSAPADAAPSNGRSGTVLEARL